MVCAKSSSDRCIASLATAKVPLVFSAISLYKLIYKFKMSQIITIEHSLTAAYILYNQ
jgi:hypothetical protein